MAIAESESSELLDVSPYEGGNMLNSGIFRTRDVRWISANLDMREGKAFGHQPYLERGPSKFGFHVPSAEEREEVSDIVEELELTEYIHEALHLPKAGKMTGLDVVSEAGEEGYYLTRIPNANGTANVFHPSAEGSEMLQMVIKNAISVRGFKNTPVVPTTGWTKFSSGGQTARLPHEYQEVEYIESDGNAFINTGYMPKNSPYFRLQFSYRQLSNMQSNDYLYGANTESSISNTWLSFENSNGNYWNIGGTTVVLKHTIALGTDINYDIQYNNGQFNVSGSYSGAATYSVGGGLGNSEFTFFCNGTSHGRYMNARLYYLKMYAGQNFDLIRDFVPCYRVSDGVAGLYDLVEGKFYINAGTGTFTKGAPVNVWEMPKGYTELGYIQNNSTSTIDTGLICKSGYKIDLKYYTSSSNNSDQSVVGSSLVDANTPLYRGINYSSSYMSVYFNYNNTWHDIRNSQEVGNTYEGSVTLRNGNQNITLNGNTVYSATDNLSQTGTTNLFLFTSRGTNYALIKLYYTKIYDVNDKLVRDFVPCVRDSDGVIGMYDLVTKQFFTNSGSGDFVAGPVVHRGIYKPAQYRTITYYPLEKDTKDLSDNQYDLTNNGHVTFESIDGLLAALFDATSTPGLINTDVTNLPQGGADMTISVWIRPTAGANSSEEDVRGLGASGTTSYTAAQLYKIFPFKAGTRGASLETSQNAVQNIWQNVIVTKSGTTWTITVNGVQIGSNTQTTSISGTNLSIGYSYRHLEGANYWYKGYMRDFIMESRAWSVEERLAYFESEKSKFGL